MNVRKINYIGVGIIVSMILYVITMSLLDYKIAFRYVNVIGKGDTVFVLLVVTLTFWVFILNLIEYRGKYFVIQFFVVIGICFLMFVGYVFFNFWGDQKLMIHETPYNDKLLFYSEYRGGGLHHPKYKTTVYQKVVPFTYKEITVIDGFDGFLQRTTIESDHWFSIEYQDNGFTIILDYYSDGEQIETEQYFEYVK